ncbi:fluoride efflux transporter CrcB [Bacillus sp. NTK074B]|uniref:fluoride efflux transporter CrcB n=1 Tax=Bacillus sp. NTK074B TaxID=2802174 RepID=UPI001A8F829B|nr:fluoride efflux transporter CrcB [Bacillus sp. NTK074B]
MVYIFVGAAGMVGALLRYYIGIFTGDLWNHTFPLGTFLANMIGSFTLGLMTSYIFRIKKLHPMLTTAIGTGLVGSFTTFSTFSVETVHLLSHSHLVIASLYLVGSASGGLLMSWAGYKIGMHKFTQYKQKGA